MAKWQARQGSIVAAAIVAGAFAAAPAAADPIEDFYRGKQIRMYVRAAPGGNYDIYSRVLGRHMTRFIPGNPMRACRSTCRAAAGWWRSTTSPTWRRATAPC